MNGRSQSRRAAVVAVFAVQLDVAVKPHHQRRHERPRNARSWRASRTPPPRPAARTDTAPRRSEKTSAQTRCRCTAWRQTPAAQFPARRREWRRPSCLPCAMCRWMFSIATVASSTRMPTASARPPSVIRLIVSPSALKARNRTKHRQRDGKRDDQRAAPRTEEQQNHQRRQRRGDDAFAQNAADGRAHEQRLVGKFLARASPAADGAHDARQRGFDARDHVQRRGSPLS